MPAQLFIEARYRAYRSEIKADTIDVNSTYIRVHGGDQDGLIIMVDSLLSYRIQQVNTVVQPLVPNDHSEGYQR